MLTLSIQIRDSTGKSYKRQITEKNLQEVGNSQLLFQRKGTLSEISPELTSFRAGFVGQEGFWRYKGISSSIDSDLTIADSLGLTKLDILTIREIVQALGKTSFRDDLPEEAGSKGKFTASILQNNKRKIKASLQKEYLPWVHAARNIAEGIHLYTTDGMMFFQAVNKFLKQNGFEGDLADPLSLHELLIPKMNREFLKAFAQSILDNTKTEGRQGQKGTDVTKASPFRKRLTIEGGGKTGLPTGIYTTFTNQISLLLMSPHFSGQKKNNLKIKLLGDVSSGGLGSTTAPFATVGLTSVSSSQNTSTIDLSLKRFILSLSAMHSNILWPIREPKQRQDDIIDTANEFINLFAGDHLESLSELVAASPHTTEIFNKLKIEQRDAKFYEAANLTLSPTETITKYDSSSTIPPNLLLFNQTSATKDTFYDIKILDLLIFLHELNTASQNSSIILDQKVSELLKKHHGLTIQRAIDSLSSQKAN